MSYIPIPILAVIGLIALGLMIYELYRKHE